MRLRLAQIFSSAHTLSAGWEREGHEAERVPPSLGFEAGFARFQQTPETGALRQGRVLGMKYA